MLAVLWNLNIICWISNELHEYNSYNQSLHIVGYHQNLSVVAVQLAATGEETLADWKEKKFVQGSLHSNRQWIS